VATPSFQDPEVYAKGDLLAMAEQILSSGQARPRDHLLRYVPEELQKKLAAAQASGEMVGERRIVTMLFCDVAESTAVAQQLDPEEWTEVINGAFELMIRPVYNYEGTVARLMGDAILAFFGAPIAHEDDPQRAVLAGLDIVAGIALYREQVRQRWGIDFNVRVGINTGLVVVGVVGSDLRMEYTAMGDAINLAARMEQTAMPGTVQISQDTYKLVAPLFDCEELAPLAVKGKAEPVKAYRVLQRKLMPGRLRGFGASFHLLVGRAAEKARLQAAMQEVLAGNGQIVCIIGDVGLGKSHLIEELYHYWQSTQREESGAANSGVAARWYFTAGLSYETTRSYSLFQSFLRQLVGITQGEPPAAIRHKIDQYCSATAADQQTSLRQVLETLFIPSQEGNQPLEGEAFKAQLYEVLTWLGHLWTAEGPGVIVCDDIHWADSASIELLTHLFQLTDQLPLFFVCAMRPDRSAPGWQVKVRAEQEYPHRYTEVHLDPLAESESRELVGQLLGHSQLPDLLYRTVLEKAAGNPFFIEEVVRTLIEDRLIVPRSAGMGWEVVPDFEERPIEIPDSLHSLLTARIDRLNESQRRTLQLAALIGPSFYYRVLKFIISATQQEDQSSQQPLPEQLGDLQRMEIIAQAARLPELTYKFRQALVQESVYNTILNKQRRSFHLKVGEALEALFPEQVDDHAILLAHHFTEGGDWERSLKYHTLAGDRAFRLYDNSAAIEHYTQALHASRFAQSSSATFLYLYTRLGRALELSSRFAEALEVYQQMSDHAGQVNDQQIELAALIAQARSYSLPSEFHDFAHCEALADQALTLAQALSDRAAEARIYWILTSSRIAPNQVHKSLEYGERSLAIARELNLREQMAFSANDLLHLYARTGQYDRVKAALPEIRSLWQELGNLPMLADNLGTAAYIHTSTGDFDDALKYSEEALAISETIRNIWGIAYSHMAIGYVHWVRGNPDLAIHAMQRCLDNAAKANFLVAQVYTRADLALVYAELGAFERALTLLQESLDLVQPESMDVLRPYPLSKLALVYFMCGDLVAAEATTQIIHSSNRTFNIHGGEPDVAALAEGLLPLYKGDPQAATTLLSARVAELRHYGLRAYLPESLLFLGKAQHTAGERDEARATLAVALDEARSLGALWYEWQILAQLAKVSEVEMASQYREHAWQIFSHIEEKLTDRELQQSLRQRGDLVELAALVP
jgi:predicted ATPase/class 3 adenylate cyclase